jgi:hypothetical protein
MAKVYTDKDADLSVFKDKTLAVLGFGSQGHAHALNLKESGLNVIIGLYEGSKSIKVAREKGFEVVSSADAVKRADVIMIALPDTKQASAYEKDIAPNLTKGKTLLFSHGFSIHYKTIHAAGLNTWPYHVYVPSFGEWGYVLAGLGEYRQPKVPPGLRFLDQNSLAAMFQFPADMSAVPAEANRLNDQALVRYYDKEWREFAH